VLLATTDMPPAGDQRCELVTGYAVGTSSLHSGTREALEKLETAASQIGARAVVGIRIVTRAKERGMAEVLVYGTALLASDADPAA
jgi:uncharacterized protein YbjQ (UPF0145 family)